MEEKKRIKKIVQINKKWKTLVGGFDIGNINSNNESKNG